MAKYILKEMNDVRNTGERKVYPKLVVNYTVGKDEFVDRVQKHLRAIDKGVVIAVTTGVADVLAELLSEGCNVTIDEIGTFSTSLRFFDDKPTEIESDDDSMAYRRVGVKDINFKTAAELKTKVERKTKFTREVSGVKKLKKNLFTPEERIANALQIIDSKGFFTLSEYAQANNLSRTVASKELAALTADHTSPIETSGRGTHKVWVRRIMK